MRLTRYLANVIYIKLYWELAAKLEGGLAYGMDWQTVGALFPREARLMRLCEATAKEGSSMPCPHGYTVAGSGWRVSHG